MIHSQLILKAAHFAARKHRYQRRKDKESLPYINHPIAVAMIIAGIGNIEDSEVLAAALLHDTIEDTTATADELIDNFGERICGLVKEVTDNKSLSKIERKQRQIDQAKNLSNGATIIKLGDKISNVMDITNTPPIDWNNYRRLEYFDWAEKVINNCPRVNKALEEYFIDRILKGRKIFK